MCSCSGNEEIDSKEEIKKTEIALSEICFLGYWVIMLFGRAMGWYEGQIKYNILFAIALLFWILKLLLTQYTLKEWLLIIVLIGISGIIYLVSGEKGIIVFAVTLLGMKGVSLKRVLYSGTIVWGTVFLAKLMWNVTFVEKIKVFVQNKSILGYVPRYYMGYSHPNVFHISYFMLVTLIVCLFKERLSTKHFLIMFAGNVFLFVYSYSLTGFLIVSLCLVTAWAMKWIKPNSFFYFVCQLIFPILLIFSLVVPVLASGSIFNFLDKLFNNRFAFANQYLKLENLKLFGNNLASITDSINTMDNSFVFSLIIYGVPMFVFICVIYFALITHLCKEKKNYELITVLCLLIGGVTEPYLFNMSCKNISIIFCGWFLYEKILSVKEGQKEFGLLSRFDRYFDQDRTGIKKEFWKMGCNDELENISVIVGMIALFIIISVAVYRNCNYEIGVAFQMPKFEKVRFAISMATLFGTLVVTEVKGIKFLLNRRARINEK